MLLKAWWWLVGWGFHLLYYQMAWTYDAVSWFVSLGQWRAWQRVVLPYVQGPRVLEVAHGPGHLLLDLVAAGYEVAGVDLSPYMARMARRRWLGAGLGAPRLVQGRGQALPWATGSFETVITTFPAPFILEAETLREIGRVLTAEGRWLIVPEGHMKGRSFLHRFIVWLYVITGQGSPAEPSQLIATSWAGSFAIAGFDLEVQEVGVEGGGATLVIAKKVGRV